MSKIENRKSKIEYGIEIGVSPEMVYEISQDYSVRYDWDPFPERIEFVGGVRQISPGTRVIVVAKNKLKMVVEFVQVKPPSIAAIKMVKGPFFISSFAGSWVFKPLPNGNTYAVFNYTIKAKKWAFPLLTNKVLRWYFGSKVRARLNGLSHYCNNMPNKKI